MLKRGEIDNFRITFNGFFLKNSKNVVFPKSVFSFDSMSDDFSLEQKEGENTEIPPAIGKKR